MSELALRLIAENKKSKSKVLDLGGSEFAVLPEELKECTWLEELNFSSSKSLYDISLLADLENLQLLACYNTQISDLSALSNLKKLRHFSCQDTPVSDLTPLRLTTLKSSSNLIGAVAVLSLICGSHAARVLRTVVIARRFWPGITK